MEEKRFSLWFAEATNDYDGGKVLLKAKRYNLAVFIFTQAAEKAVKALLYLTNAKPWGHAILNLLTEYENQGHTVPAELKQYAQDLENSYLDSRYPGVSVTIGPKDMYDKETTKAAMVKTKAILDYVEKERKETSNIASQ